jgi:hypothetical protein
MPAETAKLRLRPSLRLRYHRWGADVVLFDEVSGDTHLMPVAALELLLGLPRASQTGGADQPWRPAEQDEEAWDAGPAAAKPELVQELVRLRLVEIRKP